MAAVNPGERIVIAGQSLLLGLLYLFLYFPIFYIVYLSFMENSVWPFPPSFTWEWYGRLQIMSDFHVGLGNSLLIGLGTGGLSTLFATLAAIGLLKYRSRWRGLLMVVYLAPIFVAHILIGISTLMFNRGVLGLPAVPVRVVAAPGVGMLIEVGAIEVGQPMLVVGEVRGNPVQNHPDSAFKFGIKALWNGQVKSEKWGVGNPQNGRGPIRSLFTLHSS